MNVKYFEKQIKIYKQKNKEKEKYVKKIENLRLMQNHAEMNQWMHNQQRKDKINEMKKEL